MTRYPWAIGYGGAEIQASAYVHYGKKVGIDIDLVDSYAMDEIPDILHIVGMDEQTDTIVGLARAKNMKVVLSPVYYVGRKRALAERFLSRTVSWAGPIVRYNRYRKALEESDLVLPNSEAERQQLRRIFGLSRADLRKVRVVHNGFDPLETEPRGVGWFAREFGMGEKYALCVSMIDRRKNTLNTIKGYKLSGLEMPLALVGSLRDVDPMFSKEFHRLLESTPGVKWLGPVFQRELLLDGMRGASIHIMPSFVETPGLSNLEALACGCRIVVGDCPPVREYFSDFAIYTDPTNPSDIASGIERALRREWDPVAASEFIAKYSWDRIALELKEAYHSLECKA